MILRFRPLEVFFVLFMAVAMVRIVPFSPREVVNPDALDQAGGLPKQIAFITLFMGAVLASRRGWRTSDLMVPVPLILLLAFAALSLAWSPVPFTAARRLAVTILVTAMILLSALQLRPKTTLELLGLTTAGLALATLFAGFVFPSAAIHGAGDPEPAIVGAWRGIFYHKNHAGVVMGLGVLLAAERALRDRRLFRIGILALVVTALILTRSKTSIAGAALSVLVLVTFHAAVALGGRNPIQARLMRWSIMLGGATMLVGWFATDLQDYLLDPQAFTGRGQLWAVTLELIQRRPMLGYGYESVFQAGESGVLMQMSDLHWIRFAPHSHNGVLDLLVTTGAVGLILYAWALFIDPWRRVAALPETVRDTWQPVMAALLCFAFVQGLMEGKSFSGDSVQWAILMVVLGLSLRLTAVTRPNARLGAAASPSVQ